MITELPVVEVRYWCGMLGNDIQKSRGNVSKYSWFLLFFETPPPKIRVWLQKNLKGYEFHSKSCKSLPYSPHKGKLCHSSFKFLPITYNVWFIEKLYFLEIGYQSVLQLHSFFLCQGNDVFPIYRDKYDQGWESTPTGGELGKKKSVAVALRAYTPGCVFTSSL